MVHEHLSDHSRSRVQEWIKAGRVRVNGLPQAKASYLLRAGDSIEVEPAAPPALHAVAEEIPLVVLYEDPDVIAIDKPPGMAVHAGAGLHSGTVVNALLHHFAALSQVGGEERPGIVHRLDRYTSGVLLVARNDAAHRKLAEQFADRSLEKIYLALVHGAVNADTGSVDRPISRDPVRRVRMTARLAQGRAAFTRYQVLQRFPKFTYLSVRIGTGRTHQIRVHLSSLGHPVVGDTLYGAPAQIPGMPPLARYFLHAHRITFSQPSTGQPITVESPLPQELQAWMAALDASV